MLVILNNGTSQKFIIIILETRTRCKHHAAPFARGFLIILAVTLMADPAHLKNKMCGAQDAQRHVPLKKKRKKTTVRREARVPRLLPGLSMSLVTIARGEKSRIAKSCFVDEVFRGKSSLRVLNDN